MKVSFICAPEHTAVRVALWRALHLEVDAPPFVFSDKVGLDLVGDLNWRARSDMNPDFSKAMRASIVGRARFVEDLVEQKIKEGVQQYVILGAGLDTFAQRRPEISSNIDIFEIDQPGPQEWKKKRLLDTGYRLSENLHFVAVDFEAGESWLERLLASGFDKNKPAIFVSTGVSMYLSREANQRTLREVAGMARGSVLAMTFMLGLDLLDEKERKIMEFVMGKAKEAGTPFLSLFSPDEILKETLNAGFSGAECVSGDDLFLRYFKNRPDALRAGSAEAFLVATT